MESAAAPSASSNAPEWTVSELSGALRRTLEDRFGEVRVRGEIFGYRGPHASGHAYFCLKDREAKLDAVVWRSAMARIRFKPQEGLEVVATGRLTTFPNKSTYQLVIEKLEPAGAGALMALLDERRRTLAAEGLFATERKRPPPFLPRVVGVVTSPTGAVIRDILHRIADRFPRPVLVWPVRVQGETCGPEVAAAIAGLNALDPDGRIPRPDVVIVARGGGSLEDLWGFNDEAVVRAAVASRIPIISAIGHETDWTLLDHAADLRAPTPTGAAEMAVPVWSELSVRTTGLGSRLVDAVRRVAESRRLELRSALRALPGPEMLLSSRRQRLDLAGARLAPALLANARDHEARLRRAGDAMARHTPRLALATARERLRGAGERLAVARTVSLAAERERIGRCRDQVRNLGARSGRALDADLARRAARLAAASDLLGSLGYRSVLERGYALVRDVDGHPMPRAAGVGPGQVLELEFADGSRYVQEGSARPQGVRARRKPSPPPLAQGQLFDM